jgi:hypothetical protein
MVQEEARRGRVRAAARAEKSSVEAKVNGRQPGADGAGAPFDPPRDLGPTHLESPAPPGRGLPRPPDPAREEKVRGLPGGAALDAAVRGLRLPRPRLPQELPGRLEEGRQLQGRPALLPRGAPQRRLKPHAARPSTLEPGRGGGSLLCREEGAAAPS